MKYYSIFAKVSDQGTLYIEKAIGYFYTLLSAIICIDIGCSNL